MGEYDLLIEYTEKGSDEVKEKVIYVDLEEYRDSFSEDYFHLQQQYSKSEIENYIKPLKKDFLSDLIDNSLSDNQKLYSNINFIIEEVDDALSELDAETAIEDDDDDDFNDFDD